MVTQEDTIFVSGMDPSISEEEICQHFGAIGIIKVCILSYIYRYMFACYNNSKMIILELFTGKEQKERKKKFENFEKNFYSFTKINVTTFNNLKYSDSFFVENLFFEFYCVVVNK